MIKHFRNYSLLVAVVLLTAQNAISTTRGDSERGRWDKFVGGFIKRYFEFNPPFAAAAGRHEFDGRLPNWSPEGTKEYILWLASARSEALGFESHRLSDGQRFERDFLLGVTDGSLYWITFAEWHRKNPYFYAPALDPDVYISRLYAGPETRMRAYTQYAWNVPAAVSQIRQNLGGPLPREFIELGVMIFGGLAGYYEKDAPKAFAAVDDDFLRVDFQDANRRAIEAMRGLESHMVSLRPTANDRFALGEKKFRTMLWATERIGDSVPDLERSGRENLERDLRLIKSACSEILPNSGVDDCIAQVQAKKPADGVVAAAQKQIETLRRFVVDREIVTIPARDPVIVRETPEYARGNLAGITSPGPFEKGLASFYSISPPDMAWTEAERAAYVPGEASLLFITVHEVFPGHYVQTLHTNKLESRVGQIFVGFGFSEGCCRDTVRAPR